MNNAPIKQSLHWQRAVLWISIGFLMILVLTWGDAIFDFAHYISGDPQRTDSTDEVVMKTVIILILWIFSAYKVYQVVSRLSYLENFVHLCAWCRKIELGNQWFTLEEHFRQNTGKEVSHGMCPECAKRVREPKSG